MLSVLTSRKVSVRLGKTITSADAWNRAGSCPRLKRTKVTRSHIVAPVLPVGSRPPPPDTGILGPMPVRRIRPRSFPDRRVQRTPGAVSSGFASSYHHPRCAPTGGTTWSRHLWATPSGFRNPVLPGRPSLSESAPMYVPRRRGTSAYMRSRTRRETRTSPARTPETGCDRLVVKRNPPRPRQNRATVPNGPSVAMRTKSGLMPSRVR